MALHHGPRGSRLQRHARQRLGEVAQVEDLAQALTAASDAQHRARERYLARYPEAPPGEWDRLPSSSQAQYLAEASQLCLGQVKTVYHRQVRPGEAQANWRKAGMLCLRCFVFWPALEAE